MVKLGYPISDIRLPSYRNIRRYHAEALAASAPSISRRLKNCLFSFTVFKRENG